MGRREADGPGVMRMSDDLLFYYYAPLCIYRREKEGMRKDKCFFSSRKGLGTHSGSGTQK